jgi:hypothetical protein
MNRKGQGQRPRAPADVDALNSRPRHKPRLTVKQILAWADDHYRRTGRWPTTTSGKHVLAAPAETWVAISMALRLGHRGLRPGDSLPILLHRYRGRPLPPPRPRPLSVPQILAWADNYHQRTGAWPDQHTGLIPEAESPGENWNRVSQALRLGLRGLPGKSSLAILLREQRGVGDPVPPRLTIPLILRWANAFRERTGRWPTVESGPIPESSSPRENWCCVNGALRKGVRGLPGGTTLACVLRDYHRPRLSIGRILRWADSHYRRTGRWPDRGSGPIPEAPGESWGAISAALYRGKRGLFPGLTLAGLLARFRSRDGRPLDATGTQQASLARKKPRPADWRIRRPRAKG